MCISGLLWNCLNRFLNVGRIDSENLKYQTPRGLCKSGGCSCKVSAIYIFPERISEGRIQSLLYSHVYSTFNLIKTRSSSNKKNIKLAILDQTCILKISEWRLQAFQVFFFTGGGVPCTKKFWILIFLHCLKWVSQLSAKKMSFLLFYSLIPFNAIKVRLGMS